MSNNGSGLAAIIAGTAIGAAIGVLFAPDKGSTTRQRISDEALLAKDQLQRSAYDLKDQIAHTATEKKQTVDAKLEHIISDVSYKTEDVISTLERKLSELKDKNRKLQKGSTTTTVNSPTIANGSI